MAFTRPTNRTGPHSAIVAEHHLELVDYVEGLRNELARFYSNDAAQYGVIIKNSGAGSRALLVQDSAGATLLDVSTAGTTLGFANGTAAAPSFRFSGDTDSGLFHHATDANKWSLAAGGIQVAEVREKLVKVPGSIMLGSAEPPVGAGASADERHQLYLNYSGTGTFALDSPGLSMKDQVIAELSFAPANTWDVGAILGVISNTGGAGNGTMRALAGQMFKYAATHIASDNQVLEIGVHNAKAQTSHADNPTTYDAFYGTCGVSILSYGGDIAGGSSNPGVRSNTAIVIGSISGTNSGFKQAIVYYDTDQITKLWEVTQQGITRHSTAGNAPVPTFSFVGDEDTGAFWGGTNVWAISTGGTERSRIDASGNLCVGTTSVGGGGKVVAIGNANSIPSANPSAGGVLYAEAGSLKWRGSSGTVTTLAPA